MSVLQNVNIPGSYFTVARSMGIPKEIATDYFIRRTANKPNIQDLANKLANNTFPSPQQAKTALNRLWVEYHKLQEDQEDLPVHLTARPQKVQNVRGDNYLEQARQALERLIGPLDYQAQYTPKKTEIAHRIAVGSDVHGIFADEEAFARFCADPAPVAIICGDFLDSMSITRHRQTIDHVTMREELADGRAKAEMLARSFRKIYFVRGNHDKRPLKKIQDLAPQLMPLIIDPLDLITHDIPSFQRLSWKVPNTAPRLTFGTEYEADYFGMLGDILIGHFETFMGADAVKNLHKWLGEWEGFLGITTPKVILQAHTHSLGMSFTSRGQQLINTGCLCRPMPYQFDQAGKYQPPVKGYVALYQKQGITDTSKTEFVCLQ